MTRWESVEALAHAEVATGGLRIPDPEGFLIDEVFRLARLTLERGAWEATRRRLNRSRADGPVRFGRWGRSSGFTWLQSGKRLNFESVTHTIRGCETRRY
jgi:hypothetical protein